MNVFVDTSALYAILDGDDGYHEQAVEVWTNLLSGPNQLITTNYVIVETTALAQSRMGIDAVTTLAADLLPLLRTVWVDEATHRSAAHAHLVSGRRQLSLVDCASFESMRRTNLRDVFCFDPHFSEHGFDALPVLHSPA